jgi:alkylation response protein AidB-like acyl-CoA dehydrogenase
MITEPLTLPDHLEIRDVVRDFTRATFTSERVRAAASIDPGYDEVAWKQMTQLGWTGLGVRASAGGDDLGALVQCIVHGELGARLAPTPYLASAAFAATALDALADPESALPLLSSIADGSQQFALVLGHGRGWPSARPALVSARPEGEQWVIDGRVELSLDGSRADVLVVIASTGDDSWNLFRVDARTAMVARHSIETVDFTRSFADLVFDSAYASPLSVQPFSASDVSTVIDKLAVYLAAEMVGAAASCMEQTLDYMRTRHQFGKPIGSFQALKHRSADLAVAITGAQELVFSAASLIDAHNAKGLALASPLALARAGEVFRHTTEEAIQLHGGVGFADELDIGLYYKRALADLELLAAPVDAYARLDVVRRGANS